MQLTSAAYQQDSTIPSTFTCDGENISPELSWRDAPANAKSFVIIMHDPDAPKAGGFYHWLVYDIPANVAALEPKMPHNGRIAGVGIQGKNDSGKIGYMGPCPPAGTHRYFLRLYALDKQLDLEPGASQQQVQQAMADHILAQAELMGRYSRSAEKAA